MTCTPALPRPHCKFCGCEEIEWLGTLGKLHWYRCRRWGCYREFTLACPADKLTVDGCIEEEED